MAGQASKASGFGEDVPASLHYAVARKKTCGFKWRAFIGIKAWRDVQLKKTAPSLLQKGENFIRLHLRCRLRRDKQVEWNGATSSTFAQGYGGQASKSSLEFGEDVPASFHYAVARKKRLRLLSEVVLRTVKRRLTSSFAIFLTKKWRRERDSNLRLFSLWNHA